MERAALEEWVDRYERCWRSPGTARLSELFTERAAYSPGPFEPTATGLGEIAELWERERRGAGEQFTLSSEIVATCGEVGVVRLEVVYGPPQPQVYRDLWIIELELDGRCRHFEEWPTWPEREPPRIEGR